MAFTSKLGTKASLGSIKLATAILDPLYYTFTDIIGTRFSRLGHFKLGLTGPTIDKSVSQTIVFSQQASRNFVFAQSLTFSQSETLIRDHSASNTLTLTQSVIASRIITQSVSNSLAFSQSDSNIATHVRSLTSNLVFNKPIYLTIRGYKIQIPIVQYSILPRICQVLLQGGGKFIVLPCPDLGDSEQYTGGKLLLKNAINGVQYSYVRKTSNRLLRYKFRLFRAKSIELRTFLIANIANVLTLTNWKGEQWLCVLNNNPIEMIGIQKWDPGRERIDCTLEFEGVRIN